MEAWCSESEEWFHFTFTSQHLFYRMRAWVKLWFTRINTKQDVSFSHRWRMHSGQLTLKEVDWMQRMSYCVNPHNNKWGMEGGTEWGSISSGESWNFFFPESGLSFCHSRAGLVAGSAERTFEADVCIPTSRRAVVQSCAHKRHSTHCTGTNTSFDWLIFSPNQCTIKTHLPPSTESALIHSFPVKKSALLISVIKRTESILQILQDQNIELYKSGAERSEWKAVEYKRPWNVPLYISAAFSIHAFVYPREAREKERDRNTDFKLYPWKGW